MSLQVLETFSLQTISFPSVKSLIQPKGRALRECYLGGGKILVESQGHFSNGHISACVYPFFCQFVLFTAHTTQNSHEYQYSLTTQANFIVFTLYPTIVNHSPWIPEAFQATHCSFPFQATQFQRMETWA